MKTAAYSKPLVEGRGSDSRKHSFLQSSTPEWRSGLWPGCLMPMMLAVTLAGVGTTEAAPTGASIIRGDVTFNQQGNSTFIHAGNNSIINYQSFNISSGERVQFIQPNADSRVLNRVVGNVPTSILGTLLANGQVYLANPAGIYFGQGAYVSVGGLVAAAGNVSDQDFLSGKNHLTGLGGDVANAGSIQASSIALVGRHVANSGTITAPNGLVTLLAGDEVLLGESGSHLFVNVSPARSDSAAPGVVNSGTIHAEGGRSVLGAGDIYSMAVFNSGTIQAKDIRLQPNGSGVVTASGTLDASDRSAGASGGNVEVLGDKVQLERAHIDVAGDAGGGNVLIGGDYHGLGTTPTASLTYVDRGTAISADAVSSGNGGRVIVWSDEVTVSHGSISARGGALGGNGGFVEISSGNNLAADGPVHLGSPHGRAGTLLYDPMDIEIRAGTGEGSDVGDFRDDQLLQKGDLPGHLQYGDETLPPSPTRPFLIYQSEIEHTDANIVLQARRAIWLSGKFDNNQLLLPMDRNLTLQTRNNLGDVNPDSPHAAGINLVSSDLGPSLTIQARGAGSITLETGTDGAIAADITTCRLLTDHGGITLNAHSGSLSLGADITAGGNINLNSPLSLSLQTSLRVTSLEGSVRLGADVTSGTTPLNLSVNAARTITLDGNLGSALNPLGELALNRRGGGNGSLATIVRNAPGDLDINVQVLTMGQNQKLVVADGNLNITAIQHANLGDLGASGSINVNAPSITLIDRQPSGAQGDLGLDFVGQSISFENGKNNPLSLGAQITFAGTGNERASFATANGRANVNGFDPFQYRLLNPSDLIQQNGEGLLLDPIAVPTVTPAAAETIAMAYGSIQFPQIGSDPELPLDDLINPESGSIVLKDISLVDPESGSVVVEDMSPLALKEALMQIHIAPRDPSAEELARALLGRGLYEQTVKKERQADWKDFEVVIRRMDKLSLARTAWTLQKLLGPDLRGVSDVKASIQDAYAAFQDHTRVAGVEGFREYLQKAAAQGDATASKAINSLNLMRRLLSEIKALGLTATEEGFSRRGLINALCPPRIDPEALVIEVEKTEQAPKPTTENAPEGKVRR